VHLRIATYNIHRGRGLDRRTNPERIADVLRPLEADIIAMQEVVGPGKASAGHAEIIGAALGMGWIMAPVRELRGHQFGNMILSRFPMWNHAQHDLSWQTCEPRGAQRVSVDVGPGTLQVYNAHLGTALLERRYQAERLGQWVHDKRVATPKILLGDFNEWSRALATDILAQRLESIDLFPFLKRRRTYPGFFPLLHLDHIYYEGNITVRDVSLPKTRLAKLASDHLPLIADITVKF
jgi:endonuclease/exonuclease/phosphatase family metal-dependent hydrolase